YLTSQVAMYASAPARFRSANSRAFSDRVRCWASATVAAIWFQWPGDGSAQNRAISVSSAVRVVLLAAPSSLISLKAAVYSAVPRSGGAGGRNWSPRVGARGSPPPQCGSRPGAFAGGVGRHWPGSVLPRYGGGVTPDPSFWRSARIWSATDRPRATPASSALPSGRVASAATSGASTAAPWPGWEVAGARWAAAATAASGDARGWARASTR